MTEIDFSFLTPKPKEQEVLGLPVVSEVLGPPIVGEKTETKPPAPKQPPLIATTIEDSYELVVRAMRGRLESNIPMDDDYWKIKNEERIRWTSPQ